MTTYLGKSCSFCLPRVPFVNCRQFIFSYFPFGFEGRIWDLIVSVPDHCLSFYFPFLTSCRIAFYQDTNHHHTNIFLLLFSIPFVLKCAAKNKLKIGLRIKH